MYTQTNTLNMHAHNLPSSIHDPIVLFDPPSPACVLLRVCGRPHACFFFFPVGLIKVDTVQSRGLRGEIKVLLLPRCGGGK